MWDMGCVRVVCGVSCMLHVWMQAWFIKVCTCFSFSGIETKMSLLRYDACTPCFVHHLYLLQYSTHMNISFQSCNICTKKAEKCVSVCIGCSAVGSLHYHYHSNAYTCQHMPSKYYVYALLHSQRVL